jgi:hypothetical protein
MEDILSSRQTQIDRMMLQTMTAVFTIFTFFAYLRICRSGWHQLALRTGLHQRAWSIGTDEQSQILHIHRQAGMQS